MQRITAGFDIRATMPVPLTRNEPASDDERLWPVSYNGKQCYIDRAGRIVLQTRFDFVGPFVDGRAIASERRSGTWVIDRESREIFKSRWDKIDNYSEGSAAIKMNQKWGFVDVDGKVVVEPQYDSVTAFSEGLAGIELGRGSIHSGSLSLTRPGQRGFIDKSGAVVIEPIWFDAQPFREGRAERSHGLEDEAECSA